MTETFLLKPRRLRRGSLLSELSVPFQNYLSLATLYESYGKKVANACAFLAVDFLTALITCNAQG